MKTLILIVCLIFFGQGLWAQSLTPQGRLRKLSREVRGTDPALYEYAGLDAALSAHAEEEFFSGKATEYLKSPEHVGRMINLLDELFQLRTEGAPAEKFLAGLQNPSGAAAYGYAPAEPIYNSMDYLFKEVIEANESWDHLLTSKNYTVFFKTGLYGEASDDEFFRGIFADLEAKALQDPFFDLANHADMKPVLEKGSPDDPRLAGVLTTQRFLTRFTTTSVNHNRRRAAAVFRIFLCDPMQPVVQENLDDVNHLLDQAFGKGDVVHPGVTPEQDPHGTNPKCITCHERLDPLGQSFATSGSALMPEPMPGTLFFRRAEGPPVKLTGRGVGDLGRAIVTLPEYSACQVKHFWNWFIGNDVPIDGKLDELTAKFDELGHRPNDFIAYLVGRPEFYNRPSHKTVSYSQVSDTLAKCTACHIGMAAAPSFNSFPIGGTTTLNATWISKIVEALDLRGDGTRRVMPVKTSDWQPSKDELKSIKNWIWAGAPDGNGKNTLTPEFVQNLKEDAK